MLGSWYREWGIEDGDGIINGCAMDGIEFPEKMTYFYLLQFLPFILFLNCFYVKIIIKLQKI
jgi:hypothetical protein